VRFPLLVTSGVDGDGDGEPMRRPAIAIRGVCAAVSPTRGSRLALGGCYRGMPPSWLPTGLTSVCFGLRPASTVVLWSSSRLVPGPAHILWSSVLIFETVTAKF
jgi:hypothetical protein